MHNWFLKIVFADASQYLQSLGVLPEVIQWIISQPNAQFYINEARKNPNIQINELETLNSPQDKYNPEDIKFVNNAQWDDVFKKWVLVQLRKLRKINKDLPGYHLRDFPLIYDWYSDPDERVDLPSYTFEQAMTSQKDWHERMAGFGAGLEYHKTNPQLIAYGPHWDNPEFNGWTIQKVVSENDLKAEGNKMNHCVGKKGYCIEVNNGNIDIFSLRDPKNEPHVTAEIAKDGHIRQIMGNGNSEPDDEYKAMIKEWLNKYTKQRNLYSDHEPYEFDFDNDEDIDDQINKTVETLSIDEWGLTTTLDYLNISTAYENALSNISSKWGGTGTMYVQYIGPAIANAAWKADKYRYSLIGTQVDIPGSYGISHQEEYTINMFQKASNKMGVAWLRNKIQENTDELLEHNAYYDYGIDIDDIRQEYPDLEEDELQEKVFEIEQENQDSQIREIMQNNLPYALDDAINDELNNLSKVDPFLPRDIQKQLVASNNWKYIYSSKHMALPFDDRPRFSVFTTGIDEIDQKMTQDTADNVRKDYGPDYFAAGSAGIAMSDPKDQNVILKVTDRDDEMEIAQVQKKRRYPFLVNVFDVKQIQNDPKLYLITSERIRTLDPYEQKDVRSFIQDVLYNSKGLMSAPDYYNSDNGKNEVLNKYPEHVDIIEKYVDMIAKMNEVGFITRDATQKNVGINSVGDMVLLDFGASRF